MSNSIYRKRRQALHSKINEKGMILLFANFENERHRFRQDSSFYYLTGIHEPAVALCSFANGEDILYVPNFGNQRGVWVEGSIELDQDPSDYGVDQIRYLSEKAPGYSYSHLFKQKNYDHLINDLKKLVDQVPVYSLLDAAYYPMHDSLIKKLILHVPNFFATDISHLVHDQRRVKDSYEQTCIQKAVDITIQAEHEAAKNIRPGVFEFDVHAAIEHTFLKHGATQPSFPSIVATGINSTILHYMSKFSQLCEGDLVVVDIGAEYGMYAADLTRTYPVSGKFTDRQKEIYQLVLDCQTHIASIAKPGMYLRNPQSEDESLHFQAVKFFKKHNVDQYFPHGLGHYMGLDVHDVGDYSKPLQVGDVFTIEPGLYIRDERIGVRIEDDYVMTESGAVCLSEALPKKVEDIEKMLSL